MEKAITSKGGAGHERVKAIRGVANINLPIKGREREMGSQMMRV